MRKISAILFFVLLSPVILWAQLTIKGTVVNSANDEPLAGSSVFLSGTSIGTTSNGVGFFELINIPPGRYELIISSIGYETNVFSFTSEQLPLQVKIEMEQKVKELENVTVEPYLEESWDKWGLLFTTNFIGSAPNARNCKIRNPDVIHFRYYKKSDRVTAYADEPLIIDNRALGYTIRYQLEEFEVDFPNSSTMFAGYPLFNDMTKDRKNVPHRWREAREKAYSGSMMHFMRSLYTDSLLQNGFEVRRMVRSNNIEKERVKGVYKREVLKNTTTSGGIISVNVPPPGDSTAYYQNIMRQKDYIDKYLPGLMTADSLIVKSEGNYKALYFTDYLFIMYKNEIEDIEYLVFPRPSRKPGFEQSYIWLPNLHPVIIDRNGNYDPPQEVFSMEYWGWIEKIANMLPSDYTPEKL